MLTGHEVMQKFSLWTTQSCCRSSSPSSVARSHLSDRRKQFLLGKHTHQPFWLSVQEHLKAACARLFSLVNTLIHYTSTDLSVNFFGWSHRSLPQDRWIPCGKQIEWQVRSRPSGAQHHKDSSDSCRAVVVTTGSGIWNSWSRSNSCAPSYPRDLRLEGNTAPLPSAAEDDLSEAKKIQAFAGSDGPAIAVYVLTSSRFGCSTAREWAERQCSSVSFQLPDSTDRKCDSKIITDSFHPGHHLLQILPSSRAIKARTTRHTDSFFPKASSVTPDTTI